MRLSRGSVNFRLGIKGHFPSKGTAPRGRWTAEDQALADVGFNQCIDVESPQFRGLPRFGASPERIAAMLYQRPFAMHVHASRLLPRS